MFTIVQFSRLERWDPPSITKPTEFAYPIVSLGELAEVRLGAQVPRKGSTPRDAARHPYLRSANVRRGFLDTTDVKTMHVSERQAEALKLGLDDVLFVEGSGSITEVGRACRWDERLSDVIHQNSVVRARIHDTRLDPEFAVTWFNSRAGNLYIREKATTTSGLYHIGAGKLALAPVPLPSIEEQKRITSLYNSALNEANVALKRSRTLEGGAWNSFKSRLIRESPTITGPLINIVKFAALDRWDTDAVENSVNSRHPVVRLADVADIALGCQVPRKGSLSPYGEIAYLRAANVQRGYIVRSTMKRMRVSAPTVERLTLEPEDIVFVEGNSHEEVGRSAVWSGSSDATIFQNSIIRARIKRQHAELNPEYVSAWFNSDAGASYIRAQATSTSGSLWHIGAGKIGGMPLPVPPMNVQLKLVQELGNGLASARAALEAADHLKEVAEATLLAALTQTC